jgi:hypothetical protein
MTDTLTHHHLVAEEFNDDNGPAIMLTQQEGIEDADVVVVHPWQLRAVCEKFGIIASDLQTEKTIATLKRRLLDLRHRIEQASDMLSNHPGIKRDDFTYVQSYLAASMDVADVFCEDLTDETNISEAQSL